MERKNDFRAAPSLFCVLRLSMMLLIAGCATGHTVRVWLNGSRLSLRVLVISGRTGEMIGSDIVRRLTAYAATGREGPPAIYFKRMDRMMPSILATLGQERNHVRTLLR